MTATNGRKPKGDGPWMVKFRSGVISGPFKTDQLRWTDEGSDWCAIEIERTRDGSPQTTRPANGSYQ